MVATDSTAPLTARSGTLQTYNAAVDLIERNLAVRPEKIAYIDDYGAYTYAELARRVNRCANALTGLGRRADALRRALLLALLFRLHRHAERHGARANESDPDRRALRATDCRHPGERCRVLRSQAVFRLRTRQRAHFSAFRRGDHGLAERASDPNRCVPRPATASPDDFLRRAHSLQRAARKSRSAEPRRAQLAPVHIGRRSAAARRRPPLARTHGLGDPRRPGLDRDAAYLFVEPAGFSALRYYRQAGSRL